VEIVKERKKMKKNEKKKEKLKSPEAVLRFSYDAWQKLQYIKQKSTTEVSGFGITDPDDPLYITDFKLIKQNSTSATTDMTKEGIAEFDDKYGYELGLLPVNMMRVWIHTHPSFSATPSNTDEETFNEVFGKCNWAVMFILGEDNKYTCTLQYNTIPAGKFNIPMKVDGFPENKEWDKELKENVQKPVFVVEKLNNNLIIHKRPQDKVLQLAHTPCVFYDQNLCDNCGYCAELEEDDFWDYRYE